MKGKRPKSQSTPPDERRRAPHLTPEDEAIWRAVTETITPIERHAVPEIPKASPKPIAASAKAVSAPVPPKSSKPAPPKAPPSATPPAPFEVKRAKRLRRGAIKIEDRIDLHGMRQAEAHRALRGFLLSAHARGLRHVKVITGKGRSAESDDRPFDLHGADRPGILKRLVPAWLSEPDLAAVVVSFTGAGKQHGGEGALYVHLRRRKSRRD